MEAAAATAPRCAVHPDAVAQREPCERCGSFACDACFGLEGDEPITSERLCKACRERTGRGAGRVAWEDPTLPFHTRFFTTVREALVSPSKTFEAIGEGDLGYAASFAVATTLVGLLPTVLLVSLVMVVFAIAGGASAFDRDAAAVGAGVFVGMACALPIFVPAIAVAFSFFVDLFFAVVFHLTAMALGGKGTFEGSLRGTLYASAVRTLLAPLTPIFLVPLLGSLVQLAYRLGALAWCSVALAGTARRVHRLPEGPALVAGAAPAVVAVALVIGLFVLVFALAFSRFSDSF